MNVRDIPISDLTAPAWNANEMDASMRAKLRRSIEAFGVIVPLVVRRVDENRYEVVGGSQRLAVLNELDHETAPCVLVEADDARARLLSQALNRISGEDNPGLRAALLKDVLQAMPPERVLELLPETADTLQSLTSVDIETIADQLRAWEASRSARLKHLTFHLTKAQLTTVLEALERAAGEDADQESGNPNQRANALHGICQIYLDREAQG